MAKGRMERSLNIPRGRSALHRGALFPLWVFLAFFVFITVLYRNTLFDTPRSDHVEIFAIFQNLTFPQDIAQIAFMEFFGHPRFQPLAWLFHFFQIKAFGMNFICYHLVIIGLHALNGTLLLGLLYALSRKLLFSFFTALVFISLFTHLPLIAWPIASYSLLSVTLSLSALLSLLKFYQSSNRAFLYVSYSFAFVALFLYELNLIVPAFIFLFAVGLGWAAASKKRLILQNLCPVAMVYFVYGGLYFWLVPRYAGLPEHVLSVQSAWLAMAAVPIEFFNTVFGHNVFATSRVVIDELSFYVPFTVKSFSMNTMEPGLVKLNLLVYLVLLTLAIALRRPERGRGLWLFLLALWAFGYTAMIFLGRGVAYVLSQARHAYFPSMLLLFIGAHFYERYFSQGWAPARREGSSFLGKYGGVVVLIAGVFFINVNVAKISWTLDEYMGYRSYPNTIYYTARDWLSQPENRDNSLFISVPTYPPEEKLAWGADILPDLFLSDPRITKSFQQATHILEWGEGQASPSITELSRYPLGNVIDDFSITFGIMPHPQITEDYLEVFGASAEPGVERFGKQWWLRLYFDQSRNLPGDIAGRARVVLGYSQGSYGHIIDGRVFSSQPITIGRSRMTHIVLVKDAGTFGLIVNGELLEKAQDITDEDLQNIELPLGKLYRMGYRKPYYYAHTFIEFGRSRFSIQDKEKDYIFKEIRFNPKGFQEYHMSLDF